MPSTRKRRLGLWAGACLALLLVVGFAALDSGGGPGLPGTWTPGGVRYDAEVYTAPAPNGALLQRADAWSWTAHGPVVIQRPGGLGKFEVVRMQREGPPVRSQLFYATDCAFTTLPATASRPEAIAVAWQTYRGEDRCNVALLDPLTLEVLRSATADSAMQLTEPGMLKLLASLPDGRLVTGFETRSGATLYHLDSQTLQAEAPLAAADVPSDYRRIITPDGILRNPFASDHLDLSTGRRAPLRPVPALPVLRPLQHLGLSPTQATWVNADPPMRLTLRYGDPDLPFGAPTSLSEAIVFVKAQGIGRGSPNRDAEVQSKLVRFDDFQLQNPLSPVPLKGDLFASIRRERDYTGLSMHRVPGVGLLVLQVISAPPDSLDAPNGLLRVGLLTRQMLAIEWQGWLPLPAEWERWSYDFNPAVYVDSGQLVFGPINASPGPAAPPGQSYPYWLRIPAPEKLNKLPTGWLEHAET